MKRVILSTVALFLVALAVAANAVTAAGQPVDWTLRGSAEWTGPGFLADTFTIHGSVASLGSYSGTLHAGPYFQTDTCGPECAFVTGSIQFVTRQGTFTATVEDGGLVTFVSIASGTTYSFDLTLDISDGTRGFGHASGPVSLAYVSLQPSNRPNCAVCPIEDGGSLSGNISRGASV